MINPKTNDSDVTIIQPSFLLQKKMGGKAANLLGDNAEKKANKKLEEFVVPTHVIVSEMLKEISTIARIRGKGTRDQVWARAHEIRGLAGHANKYKLGVVSDVLCHYLNGTDGDFYPDPNLITTITVAALFTLHENADEDEKVEQMVEDCKKAAIAQRRREGRGENDI